LALSPVRGDYVDTANELLDKARVGSVQGSKWGIDSSSKIISGLVNNEGKSMRSVNVIQAHRMLDLSEEAEPTQNEQSRIINIRNKAFWDGVSARNRQLEDKGFELWGDPLNKAQHKGQVLKEQASKGGRSPKADWLTVQIRLAVDKHPDISELDLKKRLSKLRDVTFHDANEMPTSPDRGITICYPNGLSDREIPCSGLKDRLSRAKRDRAKRIARLT
jgi:hypothetical protein